MIELYEPVSGGLIRGVIPADESYTQHSLQSCGELSLGFSLPEYVEFPVGCYCVYKDVRYTLTQPENITMQHSRDYRYTLLMYDAGYLLSDFKFRNPSDGRLAFTMTGRAHEFLEAVVTNMNERTDTDSSANRIKWIAGDYIDSVEHTVSFSYNTVSEALQMIAEEFETEWEVVAEGDGVTYVINLRKPEYNKDSPVLLSYGQGNGFRSGVKRSNDGSAREIYRMYVQGGDRNLPLDLYNYSRLMLPAGEPEMAYPPADAEGNNPEGQRTYKVSADRTYIYNKDKGDNGYEDTINCEHIYPSYTGHVTGVEKKDKYYDIIDGNIPRGCIFKSADSDKMRVVFQSGMLAGREFDVAEFIEEYDKSQPGKYIGGRFKLCNQDYDGVEMPAGKYVPVAANSGYEGDKYVVFGCEMPDAYFRDAENRMFEEAARRMYENEYPKFSFTGELDSLFLLNQEKPAPYIRRNIKPGGYIRFSAPFTGSAEGELIRITGVKRNLNNPYKIDLSLSNGSAGVSFSNTINKIKGQEVVISDNQKEVIRYAKRRYRDAMETQDMLKGALLKEFTESISPLTVESMQLIAGSPQLQFEYVDPDTGSTLDFPGRWDSVEKVFTIPGGRICHYTFGKEKSLRSETENVLFDIESSFKTEFTESDSGKSFYLYIVYTPGEGDNVPGAIRKAHYELSSESQPYKKNGYTYFLVGTLSSEYEGNRTFTRLYGFTEITPGRITTDEIVCQDGKSYLNLKGNSMQLMSDTTHSRLSWHDGVLEIAGKLKQVSGDNNAYDIGVYRGDYDNGATYYKGDDVTYEIGGEICTYRCIVESVSGRVPTDFVHWKIVARGSKGENGKPGSNGAPIVSRGKWDDKTEYRGTADHIEIVEYNNDYYMTKTDSGIVAGFPAPDSNDNWKRFDGQFENIATGFLSSDKASIGGWYLIDNKLGSQNKNVYLDGNTEQIILSDQIYLDQRGISLYDKTNQLRAEIRKNDIEPSLQLGLSKKLYPIPVLNTRTVTNKKIYGSWYPGIGPTQISFTTPDLWGSGDILGRECKCYVKKLKCRLIFHFKKNTYIGAAFPVNSIQITPIINGMSCGYKYYPGYIVIKDNNTQSITLEWDEDIIKENSGNNKTATIQFRVDLLVLSGGGELLFDCDVTGSVEEFVVEQITDQMTVIAPNGFYSYTGNNNSILLSGDRVELTGGVGPVISSGDYALKVAPDGIFVTNRYTVGDDPNKWKSLFI